ncbi:MAG: NAD(+) synthase [Clostridioides sp.]|jgi:NAD+ synthase|nr:NAD(+) synthase [Clostridioides sp.]
MNNTSINEKIDKTVDWLREKVKEANAKGLIVGVSGGIDSAVCANLIKKAFPDNSMGVILDIRNSKEDMEDAKAVIEACGIESMMLNLEPTELNLTDMIVSNMNQKNLFKEENKRMTVANLRARLRMCTIYAIANNLGYLVIGTDNAAELYTGYFTKYGDGGVDLLPIANITKQEVYEWGKVLGVPSSVIDKAPTAGLWEGQTDENEMGTTYAMIDKVVMGKEDEVPQRDLEIIYRMNKNSEHKRVTPPKPPKF